MYFQALVGLFIIKKGNEWLLWSGRRRWGAVWASHVLSRIHSYGTGRIRPPARSPPRSITSPSSSQRHPLLLLAPSLSRGKPGKHPSKTHLPSLGCKRRRFLSQCALAQRWLLKQKYVGSEGRKESLRLEHLPPENPSSFFFVLPQASCVIAEMLFDLYLHL